MNDYKLSRNLLLNSGNLNVIGVLQTKESAFEYFKGTRLKINLIGSFYLIIKSDSLVLFCLTGFLNKTK